jgi:hypothetical protein
MRRRDHAETEPGATPHPIRGATFTTPLVEQAERALSAHQVELPID